GSTRFRNVGIQVRVHVKVCVRAEAQAEPVQQVGLRLKNYGAQLRQHGPVGVRHRVNGQAAGRGGTPVPGIRQARTEEKQQQPDYGPVTSSTSAAERPCTSRSWVRRAREGRAVNTPGCSARRMYVKVTGSS